MAPLFYSAYQYLGLCVIWEATSQESAVTAYKLYDYHLNILQRTLTTILRLFSL